MLGIIGILASAKRLLGVLLSIKNNAISVLNSKGIFTGQTNTITPSAWNHIAVSVSANVATFYVNGANTGGTLGTVSFTPPSQALLYNVQYLKNTSININANSFLGSNNKTFIDKSNINSLVTITSGNQTASGVTLGSVSPYSNMAWSAEFNGIKFLSSVPAGDQINFSRDDFTVELWVYVKTGGIVQTLIDFRSVDGSSSINLSLNASNNVYLYSSGSRITSSVTLSLNRWYHIALSRNSNKNDGTLYIDGVAQGTWLATASPNNFKDYAANILIGKYFASYAYNFIGYISNLRIIKGLSLYNNNFAPPNQPLKILDTSNKMWSRFFDGTKNSILSSPSIDCNLGGDDFTLDFWMHPKNASDTTSVLVDVTDTREGVAGGHFFHIIHNSDYRIGVKIENTGTANFYSNRRVSLDQWNHIRFTRIDQMYYLYINGTLDSAYNKENLTRIYSNNLSIGAYYDNSSNFEGYISNVRLIRGNALSDATLTLPTSSVTFDGASAKNYVGVFQNYAAIYSPLTSSFVFGDNDFTIECWFNAKDTSPNSAIFEMGGTSERHHLIVTPTRMYYYSGSSFVDLKNSNNTNVNILTGEWYHVAISRKKTTGTVVYLNGLSAGYLDTRATTYVSNRVYIGRVNNAYTNFFIGSISNFRIVNGTALYSGKTIDIPTKNLENIPNTVFLTLQDSTLKDNSWPKTFVIEGGFVISPNNLYKTTYSQSIVFSPGNYLSATGLDANITNFGKKSFTIEFWVYHNVSETLETIYFDNRNYTEDDTVYIGKNTANDIRYRTAAQECNFIQNPCSYKWNHYAFVREEGKKGVAFYRNGKQYNDYRIKDSFRNFIPGKNLAIGAAYNATGTTTSFLMSDLRVVKGAAMYKSDFTPPTAALSATPTIGEERYSGKFKKSGYLAVKNLPANTLNFGTNDFTIEFWVLFDNIVPSAALFDSRPNAAAIAPVLALNATNYIRYNVNNVDQITHGTAVVINKWYHVALVRKYGLGTRLFLNGLSGGSLYTGDAASTYADINNLVIGSYYDFNTNLMLKGNISNLRVVNGTALYTSNFTPNSSTILSAVPNTKLLTLQNSTLVDNSNTFTGSNSLSTFGGFYISYENPYDVYATSKTTLLTLQNGSLIDKVHNTILFDASVGSTGITFNSPYSVNEPATLMLLWGTSPLTGDASDFTSLSARGTYTLSAVDPFGGNGYSGVFGATTCLSAIYNGPTFLHDEAFTLEFWFYQTKFTSNVGQYLFSTCPHGQDSGGFLFYLDGANLLYVRRPAETTTTWTFNKVTGIESNKWNHIVLTRNKYHHLCLYVNKILCGTYNSTTENGLFNFKNIRIGANSSLTSGLVGLMSNFRITKGISKFYEETFDLLTTATSDIEYIPPTSYSYYFDGTYANTLYAVNPHLNFGLSNFTVECWVKFGNFGADCAIIDVMRREGSRWALWRNSYNRILLIVNDADAIVSDVSVKIGKWYHIAWVRDTSIGSKLYINGVAQSNIYNDKAMNYASFAARMGGSWQNNSYVLNGYISNLRITKNATLYSGNTFIVPTQPLSLTAPTLNGDHAVKFTDTTLGGLIYDARNSSSYNLGTSSFCVEFYVCFAKGGSTYNPDTKPAYIYDTMSTDSLYLNSVIGNYLRIRLNNLSKLECLVNTNVVISGPTLENGKWYHIAYNRIAGSRSILYVNGLSAGAYADSAISYSKLASINFGFTNLTSETYKTQLNGYITNARITKASIYPTQFIDSVPDTLSLSNDTIFLSLKDSTLKDFSTNNLSGYYYMSNQYETTPTLGTYNLTAINTPYTVLHTTNQKGTSHFFSTGAKYDDKTNPFGGVKTLFNFIKTPGDTAGLVVDDFPGYYSKQNPFDAVVYTTTFLGLNNNRYTDTSIYKSRLTNPLSAAPFSVFSPFLNLTPFNSYANGGSLYFGPSQSTKFLLVSSSNNIASLSSGDFTVEMWVNPTLSSSPASARMILFDSITGSNSPEMQIYINEANKVVFFAQQIDRIISYDPIPNNTWSHIAVSKYKSSLTLFINGYVQGYVNDAFSYNLSNKLMIGSRLSASNINSLSGYITDIHVVSGIALYRNQFSPPITPLSSYDNSCLLINGDNGGVIDSTGKFNLYTNGNVKISDDVPSISASKTTGALSSGSIYFDGKLNSYIFTDTNSLYFDLSGVYTVEFWLKSTAVPSTSAVAFSVRNSDTDKIVLSINNTNNLVYRSTNASVISSFISTSQITTNTWQHVALVRNLSSGTTYKTTLYIDGNSVGFTSAANTNTPKILHIGSDNNTGMLSGYIDDFRVIKDVARYTANFDKPTREGEIHNNLAYPNDTYLNNTVLLLNADSDAATTNSTFVDESNIKSTITCNGNIAQGSVSPFSPGFGYNPKTHAGSIYLDGQSDIQINDPLNYYKAPFGFTGDYTIEAWVYPLNNGDLPAIFDSRTKASSARIGSTYNGLQKFKGYITGVKTTKGVSLYKSSFTLNMVPSFADSNTTLLLNFNKLGIYDSLSKNNISTNGNVSISYDIKKYGIGSIYFNGGYLGIPSNPDFAMGDGDFTFDWNMYLLNTSGCIFTTSLSGNSNGHFYISLKNNKLCVGVYNVQEIVFNNWTPEINTWYHLAIVRENNTCSLYVNGSNVGSELLNRNLSLQNGGFIGKDVNNNTLIGYIDEFRITKNVARYTSNFNSDQSISLLYDATGIGYSLDNTAIQLDPPRYPDNVFDYGIEYTCKYTLVAGGGGGGGGTNNYCGGGGGGGTIQNNFTINKGGYINITIGAGGVGATGSALSPTKGSNSILNSNYFGNITAFGGGAGGSVDAGGNLIPPTSGGSGGGQVYNNINPPGKGVPGQGYDGAWTRSTTNIAAAFNNSLNALVYTGGGGGGAGGPGIDYNNFQAVSSVYMYGAPIYNDYDYYNTLSAVHNGGPGIYLTYPSQFIKKSLSGVGVAGGGCGFDFEYYLNIAYGPVLQKYMSPWGGGGIYSYKEGNTHTGMSVGLPGAMYRGGGGAGGSWNLKGISVYGGNGGSGCVIFEFPYALKNRMYITGNVDKYLTSEKLYLIFKSAGTINII